MITLQIVVKGSKIATKVSEDKTNGTEAGLLVCELERVKLKIINAIQVESDEFIIDDGEK